MSVYPWGCQVSTFTFFRGGAANAGFGHRVGFRGSRGFVRSYRWSDRQQAAIAAGLGCLGRGAIGAEMVRDGGRSSDADRLWSGRQVGELSAGSSPGSGRGIDGARAFLSGAPLGGRLAIAYPGDANGTSAAALAVRWAERSGRVALPLPPGKGEDLYGGAFRARIEAARPDALLVLDQGSRARPVMPGMATLVVDHHDPPPEGVPVEVYLSGIELGEEPTPTASILAWRLVSPLVELADVRWLAAVGAIGDLGPGAPFQEVVEGKGSFGGKNLVETTALVNAAKRSSVHDTAASLAALLAAGTPADVAKERVPQAGLLARYRAGVAAERARCGATPPRFADPWVLLLFSSPCQVHGPVAAGWVSRLPRQIVLAANVGYTPGNVHFSARTKRRGENLLERLGAFRETVGAPELGQGHAEATGGVLPVPAFERLLTAIGFDPAIVAPEGGNGVA